MARRTTEWQDDGTVSAYTSLNQFLSREAPPTKNIEIQHGGLPIHIQWRDQQHSTTLVMFSGALSNTVNTVPAFSGRRVTVDIACNLILISDATLKLSQSLTLAWYAGNHLQPDLPDAIEQVIKSLAGGTRLVFSGGSGGGYAALVQGARHPGSTVLAMNPQTDFSRYLHPHVARYVEVAWRISGWQSGDTLPFDHSILPAYENPLDVHVVYIQGSQDLHHLRNHWRPFKRIVHKGIPLLRLTGDFGPKHTPLGKKPFAEIIESATVARNWEDLVKRARAVQLETR